MHRQQNQEEAQKSPVDASNLLPINSFLIARQEGESAWHMQHLQKPNGAFGGLGLRAIWSLSGLLDDSALSSPLHRITFTTSDDISILRSSALLSNRRTRCAVCAILTVRTQNQGHHLCRVQEKKPCQTTFQLHVDLPSCQHPCLFS